MTDVPYKLPAGWCWVRLGEVAKREAVLLKPSDHPSRRFTYLGMEHVAAGQWDEPQAVEVNGDEIKSQVVAFRPGLVLYGKLRPYLNKVVVPRSTGVASTEFVPIAPLPDVLLPEYLGAFLRTPYFVAYAARNTTGSRQPRTRLDALWNAPIPLPPLPEQRRIVARVEELMARVREARRLREEARTEAERLWQSVLAETFPRPGSDLPEGWRWVRLGEVCEHFRESIDPRRYPARSFWLYSIPAYDEERQPVEAKGSEIGSAKLRVSVGVCLFSKLNPRIPRVWVLETVPDTGTPVASTEFMPLVPHTSVLDIKYLGQVLLSGGFLQQVRRDVAGATGSRQRLKPEVVLSALIPLPPLPEQRRIVAHLEAVQEKLKALKEAEEATERELIRLEQAILDKAFLGEM